MALKTFVATSILYGASEYFQKKTNDERVLLEHVIDVKKIDTKTKVLQLLCTTLYKNRVTELLDKKLGISTVQTESSAGMIHLYSPSLKSLEEAKSNIENIKNKSLITPLISVDLEGGSVHHFKFDLEDLRRFGVPESIIEMRKREIEYYNKLNNDDKNISDKGRSPTPSQEWIGREYDKIKNNKKKRYEFLKSLRKYGSSIAKLCEYVGIDIVLAPNLDRVDDVDGKNPVEKMDRSFGERYRDISDLALAYISGFDDYNVLVCPKHFVGNGLSVNDPHDSSAKINRNPYIETSILPFRDVLNAGINNNQTKEFKRQISELKKRNAKYLHMNPVKKLSIDANLKLINSLERRMLKLESKKNKFRKINELKFIMSSNVANNFYQDPNTPTMFSKGAIRSLKRSKQNQGLGFNGLVLTDDVKMNSSREYVESLSYRDKANLSDEELLVWESFKSGNDVVMLKNSAGEVLEEIAENIANLIDNKSDLNNDGEIDIPLKNLDESFKKMLKIKYSLGLLDEVKLNGKSFYLLNPRMNDMSDFDVIWDSFFSNQWPWLSKSKYYKAEGKEKKILDNITMTYKASKNFLLTTYRTLSGADVNEKYESAEMESEKFVIIDKSAKYAFVYNKKTQKLEKKFKIGIGKGSNFLDGENPRRIIGDYKTPVGSYKIIQKRDNDWWIKNKGSSLSEVYGGKDGAILAMAGQWHPEIALHATNGVADGEVSNGCIRLNDNELEYFLNEVPLGTFVLITN